MEDIVKNTNPNLLLYETEIFKHLKTLEREAYGEKFALLYMIENCHPDIVKSKIMEFDVIPKNKDLNHLACYIAESIIDYGDTEMIDLWNYKNPGCIRTYLERHSLFLKNTENILWLIDNYGLSFFKYDEHIKNVNFYIYNDKEMFMKLINKENFYCFKRKNVLLEFVNEIKDCDVVKIIIDKTKKIKIFADVYKDILKISFLNLNKQFINFYLETYHEKEDYEMIFLELCMLNFDGIANFGILGYLRDYGRKKEASILKLSPILEKLFYKLCKVYSKNQVIDFIINNSSYSLGGTYFTSLIRFKCPNVIKDIYEELGYEKFKKELTTQVIEDLYRYGKHIVLKYMFEIKNGELMKEILSDNYYISNYASSALYNSDDRFFKSLIPYFGNKINNLDYHFLDTDKISSKTKIRKIKLLLKYGKPNIRDIVRLSLNADENFMMWIVKKLYDGNLKNDDSTHFILSVIVKSKNINFIKELFRCISNDFNYWSFIPVIISENIGIKHLDFIFKNIFYRLDNIQNHPRYKEKIMTSLRNYNGFYFNENDNIAKFYDYILNIIKQCGIDLNDTNRTILHYNNKKHLKIGIKHGISFPRLVKDYLSGISYYLLNQDPVKPYFKLYRLIRRLEIAKEIKNKKIHKSLFQDTNVCIKSRPPVSNKPILSKTGGQMFYRDLEEIGSFLTDSEEKFIYPEHITPVKLLEVAKNPILITPKIDGTTKLNINEMNINPSFPNEYENYEVDGEYIKELDMYLVFGVRNKQNYYNCIYEDYRELKDIHPFTKRDNSNNMINTCDYKTIKKMYEDEFKKIIEFREKCKGTVWYPKKFWMIHDSEIALKVIQILQSIQEEILISLRDTTMENYIYNNFIRTDGLIINRLCNKKEYYKLKPACDMTIDLRYDGKWKDKEENEYDIDIGEFNLGGIYRCYYEYGTWKAKDYRLDKLKPNPKKIVDLVIDYHNNPWEVGELFKYHQRNYYQEFRNNPKLRNMNNDKSQWLDKFINNNQKVLDIGCGYLLNLLWKNPSLEIDGIDNDINILERYKKIKQDNKKVFIQDILSPWKLQDDCIKRGVNKKLELKIYDTILLNLSVHFTFRKNNGFLNLMREINKRSNSKTNLMVSFIDKNKLFSKTNIVKFNDGGYMKLLDKENGYFQMKYYYPWRHDYPLVEPVLEKDDIVSYLQSLGWFVKNEYINRYYYEECGYNELSESITRLVFIKLNI